jgi:hypothetical protein
MTTNPQSQIIHRKSLQPPQLPHSDLPRFRRQQIPQRIRRVITTVAVFVRIRCELLSRTITGARGSVQLHERPILLGRILRLLMLEADWSFRGN